jgi:hypothetical protein
MKPPISNIVADTRWRRHLSVSPGATCRDATGSAQATF